jgi:hypothetical protein
MITISVEFETPSSHAANVVSSIVRSATFWGDVVSVMTSPRGAVIVYEPHETERAEIAAIDL